MANEQLSSRASFDVAIDKVRCRTNSPYLAADGSLLPEAKERIDMLTHSIQRDGQTNPVEVALDEDGTFVLLEGERRFRAITQLGLKTIKAYSPIYERKSGEVLPIKLQ